VRRGKQCAFWILDFRFWISWKKRKELKRENEKRIRIGHPPSPHGYGVASRALLIGQVVMDSASCLFVWRGEDAGGV
jgi:hypothetical protein